MLVWESYDWWSYRVPAIPDRLAIVHCALPRLRKRYSRIPAQADISPSTVNGNPLHPALAAVLVYEQM